MCGGRVRAASLEPVETWGAQATVDDGPQVDMMGGRHTVLEV